MPFSRRPAYFLAFFVFLAAAFFFLAGFLVAIVTLLVRSPRVRGFQTARPLGALLGRVL